MRKGVKSFSFIFVSVLLCGTMLFSAAGCGKQKLPDNEDTLRISAFLGGYGTQFLTDIGKKFEELNPGKKVYVYDNIALTNATLEGELKLGAKYNPTDLYFAGDVKFN